MENLGYIATFFIILYFMAQDLRNLRLLNLMGTILFLIYAILTYQKPLIAVNGFVAVVHFYNLLVDTQPGRFSSKWKIGDWF